MKEKNIFDILENAEDDSMERLIEKCPGISDEQLDKILAESERKIKMKKKEIKRTVKDNDIKATQNDTVEGVERSTRPVWLAPLSMAASLILIAGIALGSTTLLKNHFSNGGIDSDITPASSVTTSSDTVTTEASTDRKGSETSATVTTTAESAETTTQPETASAAEGTDEPLTIAALIGRWTYQHSDGDYGVEVSAKDAGTVEIKADGTYTFTDTEGNISNGTVDVGVEEIGGTNHTTVNFYEGTDFRFGGYYDQNEPDLISVGNGGMARLVRET